MNNATMETSLFDFVSLTRQSNPLQPMTQDSDTPLIELLSNSLKYNIRYNKLIKFIPISLINEYLKSIMNPKLRYSVASIQVLIKEYLSTNNYLPPILTDKLRFTKSDILYLFDVRKCKEGYLKLRQDAA